MAIFFVRLTERGQTWQFRTLSTSCSESSLMKWRNVLPQSDTRQIKNYKGICSSNWSIQTKDEKEVISWWKSRSCSSIPLLCRCLMNCSKLSFLEDLIWSAIADLYMYFWCVFLCFGFVFWFINFSISNITNEYKWAQDFVITEVNCIFIIWAISFIRVFAGPQCTWPQH